MSDNLAEYRASALEKDIQAAIVRRLRLLGYAVLETGKARKLVTCPHCRGRHYPTGWQGNTVDCPDLFVFVPGRSWLGLEVKRPGGEVRPGQRLLADDGMTIIVRSQEEAEVAVLGL